MSKYEENMRKYSSEFIKRSPISNYQNFYEPKTLNI